MYYKYTENDKIKYLQDNLWSTNSRFTNISKIFHKKWNEEYFVCISGLDMYKTIVINSFHW